MIYGLITKQAASGAVFCVISLAAGIFGAIAGFHKNSSRNLLLAAGYLLTISTYMLSLYTENEFWKRWFNTYFFKKKTRIRITLPIYDTEFEISIDKDDIVKYEMAARLVTDRFNAYTVAYKGRKTEHEIALMTMLDLVLLRDKGL